MKKKILIIYNFLLTVSLLLVGIKVAKTPTDLILFLLLIPLLTYFLIKVIVTFPLRENILTRLEKHKKILAVYGLVFTLGLTAMQIKTVTSARDVFVVILFLPLTLGFVRDVYVLIKKYRFRESGAEVESIATEKDIVEGVEEIQRRKFFRTVAGAGLGLFLFYIVKPHKAEAAFFGSIPGPGTVALKDSGGTVIDPAIKLPTDGYGIADVFDDAFSVSVLYHYYGFTKAGGFWYILRVGSDNTYRYIKGTTDYQTNWTDRESLTPYDTFGNTF